MQALCGFSAIADSFQMLRTCHIIQPSGTLPILRGDLLGPEWASGADFVPVARTDSVRVRAGNPNCRGLRKAA
jgi:hypothetical protein